MAASRNPKLNVVLVGDSGVGKRSLVSAWAGNDLEQIAPLVFRGKRTIEFNGRQITLNLIVQATGEYTNMVPFWKTADVVVLVFSITLPRTLDNLESWRDEIVIQTARFGLEDPNFAFPFLAIGNKVDLEDRRRITSKRARAFWSRFQIPFYETSATSSGLVPPGGDPAFPVFPGRAPGKDPREDLVSPLTYEELNAAILTAIVERGVTTIERLDWKRFERDFAPPGYVSPCPTPSPAQDFGVSLTIDRDNQFTVALSDSRPADLNAVLRDTIGVPDRFNIQITNASFDADGRLVVTPGSSIVIEALDD